MKAIQVRGGAIGQERSDWLDDLDDATRAAERTRDTEFGRLGLVRGKKPEYRNRKTDRGDIDRETLRRADWW